MTFTAGGPRGGGHARSAPAAGDPGVASPYAAPPYAAPPSPLTDELVCHKLKLRNEKFDLKL